MPETKRKKEIPTGREGGRKGEGGEEREGGIEREGEQERGRS